MKELDKKYDHRKVEEGLYKTWLEKKYFEAGDMTKKPYCVVIPPPNVTVTAPSFQVARTGMSPARARTDVHRAASPPERIISEGDTASR